MSESDSGERLQPEFDLKRIKNSRAQIKAELTRFQTFLGKFETEGSIDQLQVRYDSIKPILEKFKLVQTEFEELMLSDFPDDFDAETSNEERDSFETKYYQALATSQSILNKDYFSRTQPVLIGGHNHDGLGGSRNYLQNTSFRPAFQGKVNSDGSSGATLLNVAAKLPQLKLPDFNGNYSEWQRFRDMFVAIVHNNSGLSDVQRFYYLEAALKGEPKNIIAALAPTDANYSTAWEMLEKRYQNKKIMINAHLKEIMNMPSVGKESHTELRQLSNTFFKNVRCLESLGEKVDSWSTILIYILISKLDIQSKREWEQYSKDKDSPTIEDFNNFLMQRCQILETMDSSKSLNLPVNNTNRRFHESRSLLTTNDKNKINYRPKCNFCKDEHFVYFCDKFKALPVHERLNQTKKLGMCSNCLRVGHKTFNCRSQGCKICSLKHATLLHQSSEQSTPSNSTNQISSLQVSKNPGDNIGSRNELESSNNSLDSTVTQTNHTVMSNYSINREPYVLLSTAIINVFDSNNKKITCRVLLDSGSQANFVTENLLKKLNLQINTINLPVSGVGQVKTNINKQVFVHVSSIHNSFKTKLSFLVIDKITEFVPQNKINIENFNIPPELNLADPEFNVPSNIDMLIGASVFYDLLCIGQIKLGRDLPVLQKTVLGWIISGKIPSSLVKTNCLVSQCLFANTSINTGLENQVEKFWRIEEIPPDLDNKINWSQEEIDCENCFINTTSRNNDGRFVVKLPLKENYLNLGESENIALKRLYSIKRKLNNRNDLKDSYQSFMSEYEELGHMSLITDNLESNAPIYYLPHHCVEKPDSLTTKVRVVFDASSKSSTNLSLNDVLKIGPAIQLDLFSQLMRFRRHNYALIGDLTKMYRNILVHPEQRDLQRIIWRSNRDEQVTHFRLNTVTYGTSSASFIATRCLKEIALEKSSQYPVESHLISSDFYMDDLLTGCQSEDELINICKNLIDIFKEFGFEIRKFQSNSQKLLTQIGRSNDASRYLITDDNCTKTLGVSWVPSIDSFEYTGQQLIPTTNHVTKRSILSFIAKLFDPLGLLGPIIICDKIILQRLWQLNISWDESIPQELHYNWLAFCKQISQVQLIRIPRTVLVKDPIDIQIHAFCDSSEYAYGCSIYLRSTNTNNEIKTSLLCAKSRVAPLKSVTLPRLELLGALLLSRLVNKCLKVLDLKINSIFLYTDSTIVLQWLSCEPRTWQNFIANRVSEIQKLTNVKDWYYITSAENPSDIISRGTTVTELIKEKLWWHGPCFLSKASECWPENTNISNFSRLTSNVPEFRKVKPIPSLTLHCKTEPDMSEFFNKYSTFSKLRRVLALCFRFINNVKTRINIKQCKESAQEIKTGYLTYSEITNSTECLIRHAQREAFADEISLLKRTREINHNSKLKSLAPFLDKNDLLRVGGRLINARLSNDSKFPLVLPANHFLTARIIEYEHKRTIHSGAQCTLAHIRQKYWPLNAKQVIRKIIRRCITCFRSNPPENVTPIMGNLPSTRVVPSRPFSSVAVDNAGPFELKDGKLRTNKVIKAYVCIFVCQATKAVHIEVVSDLTSDGFLSMLKRFVSRRGIPSKVYTDNATCFIGSKNELIKIQNLTENDAFQGYVTNSNITWHFMPARSPHFGGLHEAAVKSCKHHLKRVLNQTRFHYEEFYTLTTQIEAILNSRPLIPMSSDPSDLEVLTPGHFLVGHALTAVPEQDWTDFLLIPFIQAISHK